MNFKGLDELIHSGEKEIVLDADVVLENSEAQEYNEGIKLDVEGLAIDGNGHSIDACGKTRIFEVFENVSIKNIILKNARFGYDGYAYPKMGKYPLDYINSKFFGGAIFVHEKGALSIADSTLSSNNSKLDGGAIFSRGNLSISNCIFKANDVGRNGAAIDSSGNLRISNCIFKANEVGKNGGAIYAAGNLIISSSKFKDNRSWYGGAIYNHCTDSCILDCEFSNNYAMVDAGAIYNNRKMQIAGSILKENVSKAGNGAIANCYSLVVRDSTFSKNRTLQNQQACEIENFHSDAELTDVKFENTIDDPSKECIINDGKLVIKEEFSSPLAKTILNKERIHIPQSLRSQVKNSGEMIEYKMLDENKRGFTYLDELVHCGDNEVALDCDIAIDVLKNEETVYEEGIKLEMEDLVIDAKGHSIDAQGLARIFYITGRHITIKNATLMNGRANSGGAIYNNKGYCISLKDCILSSNRASNDLFFGGGAIYYRNYSVDCENCTFKDNWPDDIDQSDEFEH